MLFLSRLSGILYFDRYALKREEGEETRASIV